MGKRTRIWWFVVYPESVQDGWINDLQDLGVYGFVSPLHDSDVDGDGEKKKPHYHVLLNFSGVKSYEQVAEIAEKFNSPSPQYANDWRGACRYLCHLDTPHKAQYDPSKVMRIGGGDDYLQVIGFPSEKYRIIGEMMDYIRKQDIRSFASMFDYARDNNEVWFRCLCDSSSYVIREYIKSYAYEVSR